MTPRDPLRDELDGLLEGPLVRLRGKLVTADTGATAVPGSKLIRPDTLEETLETFGEPYGDADPRAVASLWSQWYFGALIPPTVAASILAGRVLPVRLEHVAVILDEEERHPVGFRLPHEGSPQPGGDPSDTIRALIHGHLVPFVEAFARETGVGERALWCNAGRSLQWILDELGDPGSGGGGPPAAAPWRELLDSEQSDDGRPNPLYGTIDYVREGEATVPRRRVCCLRYVVPGVEGCGSLCPLPEVRAEDPATG